MFSERRWLAFTSMSKDEFVGYKWPASYTNFRENEKMNENEVCTSIDADGVWRYERCDQELPFICYQLKPRPQNT